MRFTFNGLACFCAAAQLVGTSFAATVATDDPYRSPVYAPNLDCKFDLAASNYTTLRWDTGPVLRTVIPRFLYTNATNAISEAPFPTRRLVSYRYTFSLLDQTLPANFSGIFTINKTQVVVYKGPTGQAIASDLLYTDPLSVTHPAWTSSTFESRVGANYFANWDVRVLATGTQVASATSAARTSTVAMLCTMSVPPYVPPYVPPTKKL
jgi:hypothetical protein